MAVDLRQTHFRFGSDDGGSESTHGWLAAEDTDITLFTGLKFLLRFTAQEAGGTATVDTDFQFQYNKNSAGWNDVTTSSNVVKAITPSAFSNGANCTKRLSGTGTFESSAAGCTTDGGSGGTSCDIVANGNTETECGLQLVDSDIADGDTIQFRITSPDYTISYDVTPTLTVEKTGITVSKSVAYSVLSNPITNISVSKAVSYSVLIDIQTSINVSKAVVYTVLDEEPELPEYDDGGSPGGFVFGGEELSAEENNQEDGECFGGFTFGGEINEQWQALPNNSVATKGGTYRISGTIYTLQESLSYPGLGSIAALVDCGDPPATAGYYRYDLLSIDASGDITVTSGVESITPVMPDTPDDEVKLDHVLRYYGQTNILQADIGKIWIAPQLTSMTAVVADDELAWGETSTAVTLSFYDQYGQLYTGSKTVTAEITTGNGSISPPSKSGSGSSFSFTYTRGGNDPGDISPRLTFTASTGAVATVFIKLYNAAGSLMI